MTSNAINGVSFILAGLSAGKYSLFCIQQSYFVISDGPCWETKYYIGDLESFPFMSPIRVLYKCLQVHLIANAQLVRFVLVRLSPNWPNTNKTAVNGRCQQEMWQHTPRFLFHRERVNFFFDIVNCHRCDIVCRPLWHTTLDESLNLASRRPLSITNPHDTLRHADRAKIGLKSCSLNWA